MRFRRLHAQVFGVLRDRAFELPPEAALIFGANESGKSTFRSALETILYGFDPAHREEHELALWDGGAGGDLKLEALIERENGLPLRVERELLSRGRLRWTEGEADFTGPRLGNTPLECVSGLSRALFRAVYSLELEQLAKLDGDVQAHVDELLLPQACALPLRPIAELRNELRKAHQSLWRPDRRGNTRANELLEEARRQRKLLGEAAARERELRDARAEQANLGSEIVALESQRRELDRAHDDAPFLGRLHEWKRRSHALGSPVDLAGLGEFAFADPALLASEIASCKEAEREPNARLARAPEALGEPERAVLAAAADIELAGPLAGEHRSEAQRRDALREDLLALQAGAARDVSALLGRKATPADLDAARTLALEALRTAHANWAAARSAPVGSLLGPNPFRPLVAAVASFALAAVFAWLAPALGVFASGLVFGAAALGSMAVLAAIVASRRPSPAPPQLAGLLAGIAPAAGLLDSPEGLLRVIERLERAQETLAKLRACEAADAALAAALRTREERIERLCARLAIAGEGDVEARVARLSEALRRSREREQRVELDRQERLRAQEKLEALRPGRERLEAQLERVEAVLRSIEPQATGSAAFARVEVRLRETRSLAELEADLRRDPRFSGCEHDARVAASRDPLAAEWTPEAMSRREGERAACMQALTAAHARHGEITSLLREDPGSRQARAADLVRAAEDDLAETQRERDRLALLDSIVTRAEHAFREQHQPDVLRRAGAYLERVTHGRWRKIAYSEGPGGGLFVTGGEQGDERLAIRPLSRGTLDQIFLCLRLGLLDHLDEGRERLPLVLDDALLRMDDARRAAVYELLSEISRRRQVFLLTCQEWIASEAERALKLRRITLTD